MIQTFNIGDHVLARDTMRRTAKDLEYADGKCKEALLGQNVFVIGVKGKSCSLETFLKVFPKVKVVHKFPETPNANYLYDTGDHTLQPAIVTWKE